MAWNEPGGNNKDPWNGKGNDQGPPDLDEVVKKLQDKMGGLFGGRSGGSGSGGSGNKKGNPKGLGLIIAVLLVGFLAFQSFYTVNPAERGVVLRFGEFVHVTQPGPHFLIPFIDRVIKVDVDQISRLPHRAEMLTSDENMVDVSLNVQYRIQDPADYLFQDSTPEKTIKDTIESALREVVGKSKLDEIITQNRSGIADSVRTIAQGMINDYKTGMIITSVNIQAANPPEAVKEAFDDANRAREDKIREVNKAQAYSNDIVPRARGAAATEIANAKGYKAKVVAEAEGESQRFKALLTEYEKAPEVTRQRLYLETMQDVLANTSKVILDVKSGSNLTYLPLDKIMDNATQKERLRRSDYNPQMVVPNTQTPNAREVRSRSTR
ncbi:MAG: FtsH protease activity modulator HflK [Gammaproteobacteria bacterium]|jgi:modulator of FtsH protease HflK